MIKRYDNITIKSTDGTITISGYVLETDISGVVIVFRANGLKHILDTNNDTLHIGDLGGTWETHPSKFHLISHTMTEWGSWLPVDPA